MQKRLYHTDRCRECGELYDTDPRHNDGYCNGCRNELNDFGDENGWSDEWREKRRCPTCHDDATAYNVNACPTCLGEGWI